MNIADFNRLVIQPAVVFLPPDLNTIEARVQLVATAGVESHWSARKQVPGGQARGYFQCEKHGAVAGVLGDPVAAGLLRKVCTQFDVPCTVEDVFEAIAYHDILAVVLARLTYSMDPNALPNVGNVSGGWACYNRNWRPGKPDQDRWYGVYALVMTNIK
jgi:hypothetical protein